MCAINPALKKRYIIDVYTSDKTMDRNQFNDFTMETLLSVELELNTKYPRYRFHLKESKEQAD